METGEETANENPIYAIVSSFYLRYLTEQNNTLYIVYNFEKLVYLTMLQSCFERDLT